MSNPGVWKYNESLDALQGEGRRKDEALAFRLNAEAAAEGYGDAILAMGWFYLNGVGTARDLAQAEVWYKRSARAGEMKAMYSLGEMAFAEHDYGSARVWLERAQVKGHAGSYYLLGKMYWRGCGVPLDRKRARRLITEAARRGYEQARRIERFLSKSEGRKG